MNPLEAALRQYEWLAPSERSNIENLQTGVRDWLTEYVIPVVDQFARRASFQAHARWPIDTFASESDSIERSLVAQIECELKGCRRSINKLLGYKAVQEKLTKVFPATRALEWQPDEDSPEGADGSLKEYIIEDVLADRREAFVKLGRWIELPLVNPSDYFVPQLELFKLDDGRTLQSGELFLEYTKLPPIGNVITRCLQRRIDLLQKTLKSMDGMLRAALGSDGSRCQAILADLAQRWQQLDTAVTELKSRLLSDERTRVREASVVLTQVYAAFHPRPDLSWLNLDQSLIDEAQSRLSREILSYQNYQLTDQIAMALRELEMAQAEDPELPAIEDAIESDGLVIVEARHEVYWNGMKLDSQFPDRPWSLHANASGHYA